MQMVIINDTRNYLYLTFHKYFLTFNDQNYIAKLTLFFTCY